MCILATFQPMVVEGKLFGFWTMRSVCDAKPLDSYTPKMAPRRIADFNGIISQPPRHKVQRELRLWLPMLFSHLLSICTSHSMG